MENIENIVDFEIGTDRTISSPSKWFNSHPGEKPSIIVANIPDTDWYDVLNTVKLTYTGGKLDVRLASYFIYKAFCKKPEKLTEDWESFCIKIGKKDQTISINNIVDFKMTEKKPCLITGGDSVSEDEILKMLIVCCSIYRLIQIQRPEYRSDIITKLRSLCNSLPGANYNFEEAWDYYRSWLTYRPYQHIMACVDMFLGEFEKHIYSHARIGTILSRLKDCSALETTLTIINLLGFEILDFAEWIWTNECGEQFYHLVKKGEEIDNPRSYAMYFMDLGLSNKSPYSPAAIKDLHFMYHTLGASFGLDLSKNEIMIGNPKINILDNAMVLYYVITISEPFIAEGKDLNRDSADAEPNDASPESWRSYILKQNGTIPAHIIKHSAKQWIQYNNCRYGTIGQYLYNKASVILQESLG